MRYVVILFGFTAACSGLEANSEAEVGSALAQPRVALTCNMPTRAVLDARQPDGWQTADTLKDLDALGTECAQVGMIARPEGFHVDNTHIARLCVQPEHATLGAIEASREHVSLADEYDAETERVNAFMAKHPECFSAPIELHPEPIGLEEALKQAVERRREDEKLVARCDKLTGPGSAFDKMDTRLGELLLKLERVRTADATKACQQLDPRYCTGEGGERACVVGAVILEAD